MTFDDINVNRRNGEPEFSDETLLRWATDWLDTSPEGYVSAIIKQWVRLARRLAAWERAAQQSAKRVDNATEEESNRRLHMLERQNELFARLIGELRNKLAAQDDGDKADPWNAIEEFSQRLRALESIVERLERTAKANDVDIRDIGKSVKTAERQIEAISGNVERLRDEVRKIPRRDSMTLVDIVERLVQKVEALERSQFMQGVVGTTTAAHPNHVEEGGTVDMTPRCNDDVIVTSTHPFGTIGSSDADG